MSREEKINKMIEEIKIRRNDEQYSGGPFPIYHIEFDILNEEIERLNNIINELEKCIKDKYYEEVDYQIKIRQNDLIQGDYPISYYISEQNEHLCNYFLNRLKDLQELKGE